MDTLICIVGVNTSDNARNEDLHAEKALEDKDLCIDKVPEEKTYALSKADEPCHRSDRRSRSPKMETSGKSTLRHLELQASKVRTCLG